MGALDDRDVLEDGGERLGVLAPQNRDQGLLEPLDEASDGCLSEGLPPDPAVTTGLAIPDREDAVEEKNTLLSPGGEVAAGRDSDVEVACELLEDVLQRRVKIEAS